MKIGIVLQKRRKSFEFSAAFCMYISRHQLFSSQVSQYWRSFWLKILRSLQSYGTLKFNITWKLKWCFKRWSIFNEKTSFSMRLIDTNKLYYISNDWDLTWSEIHNGYYIEDCIVSKTCSIVLRMTNIFVYWNKCTHVYCIDMKH